MAPRNLASPCSPGTYTSGQRMKLGEHLRFDELVRLAHAPMIREFESPVVGAARALIARDSLETPDLPSGAIGVRSRFRLGASRSEEIDPSLTTNDPGECSLHSLTTPRLRRDGSSERIASRTTETPFGL